MSNDHLVSKTYIKWFQNNTLQKPFCSFYKLVKGKLQWTKPTPKDKEQICYEKGRFFRKTEEEFNKKFENYWDILIKHLNQFKFSGLHKNHYKKNRILNSQQVSSVLNFIFIHHKRTKYSKTSLKTHPASVENLKKYKDKIGRELKDEEIDEFYKIVDNTFVTTPQQSFKILKKRPWLLIINETKTPFVTSCAPVLWPNNINNMQEIYAPLSPQFAILISLKKHKEKTGIVIEFINETNIKKFNKIMKETLITDQIDKPILISNKKDILIELTK